MKTKNKNRFIVYVVALLVLCLSSIPQYSSASTISRNIVEENEIQPASMVSAYITVEVVYWGQMDLPPSLYYNHNGYSGTLFYVGKKPNSDKYIYGGYVYCQGLCLAPTSIEKY